MPWRRNSFLPISSFPFPSPFTLWRRRRRRRRKEGKHSAKDLNTLSPLFPTFDPAAAAAVEFLDGEMYVVSKRNSYVYQERETPVWRLLVTEGRDEESDLFFAFSFKYQELS